MKLRTTNNLILTGLIFVSLLFFSGCYTQLAKPDSNRIVQDTYTEESEDYYEDEEYAEDYEDYEDYEEGDIEDYDEMHITRRYYNDTYVYGGYPSPWYYDPFYDPYFYDSYAPYSSHVSIHVGYRDPFFIGYHRRYYDPFYDPFFYGYYGSRYSFRYTSGFYFNGGCLRSGSYRYYGNYYPGTTVATVRSVPTKQRDFTRRGRRGSDFGYERSRDDNYTPVSTVSAGTSRGKSITKGSASSQDRIKRRKRRSEPRDQGRRGKRIERTGKSSDNGRESSGRRESG
ncbi:hypothetical protein IH824_09040, partial [candidate division KSB1 bacterium]|nr:hypothetical protein [candidate division KSB1 bacterium]